VIGSFITSVLFGIAVVVGLTATSLVAPSHHARYPAFDIAVGVLILVIAAWLRSERSAALRRRAAARRAQRRPHKTEHKNEQPSRSAQILSSGSIGLVAALGVAMHLPGLLYLAALGEIAYANTSSAHTLLVIVLFNLVMLAPIELPLIGYIAAPQRTERVVQRVNSFVQEHRAQGLQLLSALAGGYLIVIGALGLIH